MKNKIFICGYYNFPRGSASANYIQYLSQAFIKINYEIIIISNINYSELQNNNNFVEKNKENIILEPYELKKGKLSKYLDFNFRLGLYIKERLEKYEFGSEDLIIAYSTDVSINKVILKVGKNLGVKTAACIVEWFPPSKYKYGLLDYKYWRYYYTFHFLFPKHTYLFPISSYIENYFHKKGCRTFILPIMADPEEYEYIPRELDRKRKFIYPANSMKKDSVGTMLKAIEKLNQEELQKVEFNFCGINKEQFDQLLTDKLKDEVGKSIIFHNWMSYDSLVCLYRTMHFLIIARDKNQLTLANFPSKVPEMMCYGVIPVVSQVGDYTKYYLINHENSIFIDECSPEAIYKTIQYCLALPEKKFSLLSANARLCTVKRFNYNVWVNKIDNFLNYKKVKRETYG